MENKILKLYLNRRYYTTILLFLIFIKSNNMVNKTYILSGLALLVLLNNNKNKEQVSRSENKETDTNTNDDQSEKKDIDINTNDDQNELKDKLNILENEISNLKNYTERNFNLIGQIISEIASLKKDIKYLRR
jgi:predicted RNase H-like nuclease (RuvC/YqgF family)